MSGDSSALSKEEMRKSFLEARDQLLHEYREKASAAIAQHILQLPEYAEADVLFAYSPIRSEVDIRPLIDDALRQGKRVALPACVEGSRILRWQFVSNLDELAQGSFGILEPHDDAATKVPESLIDGSSDPSCKMVAIVPGAVFDQEGYRIGYGGGYYDVFLESFRGASIGVCFASQVVEKATGLQEFDKPVDMVVFDEANTQDRSLC